MNKPTAPVIVCALYRFVRLDDYRELQQPLLALMRRQHICGTLLLAGEGINGTVAGSRHAIDTLLDTLQQDTRLAALDYKESVAERAPFKRARVRLKREIVTMGVPGIDPVTGAGGTYVAPAQWNALLDDPDLLLLDTRNEYEVRVGSFRDAVNPGIGTFREFPDYVRNNLDPRRHRKVAMFCTGGIRCEKSTALLRKLGFEEVYHLQGGILNYLKNIPEQDSRWEGECFVFDERVTVDHRLEPGSYTQCNACRQPVSAHDMADPRYVRGISCPHCHDSLTESRKARFSEREKQSRLACQRGEVHMGDAALDTMRIRRAEKRAGKQRQRTQSRPAS